MSDMPNWLQNTLTGILNLEIQFKILILSGMILLINNSNLWKAKYILISLAVTTT